jgi:hypothetical protein
LSSRDLTDETAEPSDAGAAVAGRIGEDTFRGRTRLERALLPYLREQTLWPVLFAVLVHVIALVAPLLVLGLRDGHLWSLLGVGAFGALTGTLVGLEVRERRRPGLVTLLIGGVWLACAGGAFAVLHFEIV